MAHPQKLVLGLGATIRDNTVDKLIFYDVAKVT